MGKLMDTIAAVLGIAKAQELAHAMRAPQKRHVVYHHNGRGHGTCRRNNTSQRERSNRRSAKRAAKARRKG